MGGCSEDLASFMVLDYTSYLDANLWLKYRTPNELLRDPVAGNP
jgi:hypothetical protein